MRLDLNAPCSECGRTALWFVAKKYPAKSPLRKYVCGYHSRSYNTSEYERYDLVFRRAEQGAKVGYAPREKERPREAA